MRGCSCGFVVVVVRFARDGGICTLREYTCAALHVYLHGQFTQAPRVSAGCTSIRVTGHESPAANAKGQAKGARILHLPCDCMSAALLTHTALLSIPDGMIAAVKQPTGYRAFWPNRRQPAEDWNAVQSNPVMLGNVVGPGQLEYSAINLEVHCLGAESCGKKVPFLDVVRKGTTLASGGR
jgi:hypothetical protein